jgi:DNA polymerase III alpha subunit
MAENVSEDWNDLKLIKGVISGAWAKETRNGNMMGFLKLISEDGDDSMVAKFSRIYEQVNYWDDGSLVYVLGQITPATFDEETGELQYDVSAWGNLIVPIEAFEKEVEEADDEADDEADEDLNSDLDEDWADEDWD